MRHLNSLFDLTTEDVLEIFSLATRLKSGLARGERPPLLEGRVLTQVFEKPSLRTRISFEAAMMQLGGSSIFLSGKDAGLDGRESLSDVARVLSSYSDVVVLRTFSQQLIDDFAHASRCPVINGLSDKRHPCQALTDLFTVRELCGELDGRRLLFIGDGNNVAASLAAAAALLNVPITLCTPDGYQLPPEYVRQLHDRFPGADLVQTRDISAATREAGIIYTDVWASMGQEQEAEKRKKVFAPYQVNAALLGLAPSGCRFMHCLPAQRGSEVTDEVMDGPQSIAFEQAENRMHLAKGLMLWLLGVNP